MNKSLEQLKDYERMYRLAFDEFVNDLKDMYNERHAKFEENDYSKNENLKDTIESIFSQLKHALRQMETTDSTLKEGQYSFDFWHNDIIQNLEILDKLL